MTTTAAKKPPVDITSRRYTWKVTASSFVGNTLEYYDFLVYGTAAAIAFPTVFFPASDSFVSSLGSFATFAVGFFARPIGGMFFGRRGDLHGRKSTLITTLMIMGICTFLIGVLPTYAQVGWLAPILLILLRVAQGFAVGGEWGGSMIIVLESAPQHRRGFFSAWPNTGGFSAQILITLVMLYVYSLSDSEQLSWGWRIPFLLSAVVMLVGLWMRRSLEESPVFTDAVADRERTSGQRALTDADVSHHAVVTAKREAEKPVAAAPSATEEKADPLWTMFRKDWRSLLLILGLRFAEALPYFLLTVFVLSYAPKHVPGITKSDLNLSILIMAVLAFAAHGLWATLSDKIGRRPVYFIGAAVVFVMAFPFFALLHTGSFVLITLGYVLMLNVGHNAINSIQPAFFAELFPADRRYSGAAAGREIASIVAGGLTPFIATWLAGEDGTGWQWVAAYVMLGAVITMVAVKCAPETFRRDLRALSHD